MWTRVSGWCLVKKRRLLPPPSLREEGARGTENRAAGTSSAGGTMSRNHWREAGVSADLRPREGRKGGADGGARGRGEGWGQEMECGVLGAG